MTLVDILKRSAQLHKNRPAVSMRRGYRTLTFSYEELYTNARRLAALLQAHNIQQGENVVILAPNSPLWVTVFFGTLIHGCRIVPLNIQSTPDFVRKTIENTNAKIVFKYAIYTHQLPKHVHVFDIDFLDETLKQHDAQHYDAPTIKDSDLAQILYTSGTTGNPKGVMLSHTNIVSNVIAVTKLIQFKPGKERLLSILPLSHILEQTVGMVLPIYCGVHIVYSHTPAMIADLMHEYRITKIIGVPEFLQIIRSRISAHIQKSGRIKEKIFTLLFSLARTINCPFISRTILFRMVLNNFGGKLNTIASGGAPLDPDLERWWNTLGVIILQGYGLTETSPIITMNTYKNRRSGSVGKPIEHVNVRIEQDGEVLVKGPNVFQGYYHNQEQTDATFTPDGWFKTGDMGTLDLENFLFLRGRKKYMIKGPGGQNVFPEDIEEVLNRITGVRDSTVIGLAHASGAVEIHAVLLLEDHAPMAHNIITHANQELASYQQITGWTVWHEQDFPRSATRKVKKEVVRAFLEGKQAAQPVSQGEQSVLIKVLAQITNMPITQIRAHSSLVRDLKIDSLRRVELVSRIEHDLHVIVDETAITPTTTVQELQEVINKKEPLKPMARLPHWPTSGWARMLRVILQEPFLWLSHLFMRTHIQGLQNLKNIKGPVIFMPSHVSNWDGAIVARALPFRWRRKLSFAAAQDVLYDHYWYVAWLANLTFNCFPLPRQESHTIKTGLENTGRMLDRGYNVVIFPEGKISLDGNLCPLKEGSGLFATQMGVTIVPIRLYGVQNIFPYDTFWPRRRGTVKIVIGQPITFTRATPYEQATVQIQKTLKELV